MVNLNELEGYKLLELLHNEWDKRVVGEILAREILFAIGFGGSLCLNSQKTSNNLIVNSKSGAGKDYVTTEVLNIIPGPEERWIKRTRITKTAFTYWHSSIKEPDWTWNGKIFYGEDMNSEVLNSDVFKVMCSGGSHSTIVKDQVAVNLKINGKPSIIITAAKAVLTDELLRRFAVLNLNESKEQDDMIIDFQSKIATLDKKPEYNESIMVSLTSLKQVNVLIDFAEKFGKVFKDMNANVIVRTSYNRFIDLIKFSAVIFQNQRTWLDEKTIFANSEDYDKAVDWFVHLFKNQCLLPITKDQEKLLQIINTMQQATVTEIISEATFASRSWIYLNLNLLTEKGFLEKTRIADESEYSKKKIDSYTVPNKAKLKIPYWGELE
ncbi:MAG: hypothetical protein PHN56_06920 [Candidatus Nanoarchaeia archaeon]|nr:hypothetical protein [Candidatus Nanoarchaeia archaeon]